MMHIPLQNILFLDIETVSQFPDYDVLPADDKAQWNKKAESLQKYSEQQLEISQLYGRAAIYAEFGKIVCISCGIFQNQASGKKLFIKSFYGDDEKQVLVEFVAMLNRWSQGEKKLLCAHNGKEFDFPYLCRRLLINSLPLPALLQIAGKKPWEIPHLDTMELWKFGDYKNYTSVNLLAHIFNIPSPKDDIDGSMVGDVYWKNKDIERIVTYCQKDVVTLVRIYQKLNLLPIVADDEVEIKE